MICVLLQRCAESFPASKIKTEVKKIIPYNKEVTKLLENHHI